MARWTDDSEYPVLSSLAGSDRLMVYRPGTGQRQVAASNLPSGTGGGSSAYDLLFEWLGLPEPSEQRKLLVPRTITVDLTTFDFFKVAFLDAAPTASVTVDIDGVAPAGIQVTFNTSGEMTNLNGAALEEIIEAGAVVTIAMPSSPDATMEGVQIVLLGQLAVGS